MENNISSASTRENNNSTITSPIDMDNDISAGSPLDIQNNNISNASPKPNFRQEIFTPITTAFEETQHSKFIRKDSWIKEDHKYQEEKVQKQLQMLNHMQEVNKRSSTPNIPAWQQYQLRVQSKTDCMTPSISSFTSIQSPSTSERITPSISTFLDVKTLSTSSERITSSIPTYSGVKTPSTTSESKKPPIPTLWTVRTHSASYSIKTLEDVLAAIQRIDKPS